MVYWLPKSQTFLRWTANSLISQSTNIITWYMGHFVGFVGCGKEKINWLASFIMSNMNSIERTIIERV